MRINGTESECPRCHRKFDEGFRFECPFCGGLIPKGSDKCPTCQIDLRNFGGHDGESVEQRADGILEELMKLESSLIKQEQKRDCCPDCSWLLTGSESKCPKCGRSFVGEGSLTCPICTAPITKDAKECGRCGAKLRAEEAPQPRTAAPDVPTTPKQQPAMEAVHPERTQVPGPQSFIRCPDCGATAGLEVSVCSTCGASLVEKKEPPSPQEEPPPDAATEALRTLKEIERQARGPRSRKLRSGKVTSVQTHAQASARGISNGLGQTNGTSMTNGRGRVNGTGRVNGRVNGTGAVNGRSFVNGAGMSNGLRAKANAYTTKRNRLMLRWQFIAILVVLVVVIPTVVFLQNPSSKEPIKVDGDSSDWADVPKFGARTQSGTPSLDIVDWATLGSAENLYLYARTNAATMASEQPESFFLFMDTDGSSGTGYMADSIGADYLLRIEGWNGSVQSASLDQRKQGADQYDWNSWEPAGSARAAVEGTDIEAVCILPEAPSATARCLLMSKDSAERTAITYAAPTEGGLLIVELEPSAEAADGVIPSSPSVSVLRARCTCQGAGGSVSGVNPALSGTSIGSQIQGFSLTVGGEHTFDVSVNTGNTIAEHLVTANLASSGFTSSFSAVQIVGNPVTAYVGAAPQEIVIDGVFGDWAGKTTADSDSVQPENPDVDIDRIGNSSTSQSSFFYVSVKGELGKGCPVPALVRKPSGAGNGGHEGAGRQTGEDLLRIYIDIDTSSASGLGVIYDSKVIGAERKIEIAGVNGRIVSATSWNYSGGNWIQSSVIVNSMKDYSQIEIGIDSMLVNRNQYVDYIVETTCWKNEFDRACYEPNGTRALIARAAGNAHTESWVDGISASPWATSMSYQRKIFWDGINFWSFYFDGTRTIAKYSSTGGATWTGIGAVFTTSGVNETSVWYDSANNAVYAIGDTSTASTNVYIQKGTVSPSAHTITWAASDSVLATSANNLAGKNTFISRDANGYIWVLSSNCTQTQPLKYGLTAFKSTSADSITAWAFSGQMLATSSTDEGVKGSIVPAGSGSNVWSIYAYGGSVASRKYTTSWQTPQTSIYAPGGQGLNAEIAPPSVVVDGKGVVHVIYGTGRKSGLLTLPSIEYSKNNTGATTFTTPVDLDPTIPSGVGDIYPTITLDSATGNLYAFWLRTDTGGIGVTVMGKICTSGTWSALTLGTQTSYPKQYLTSIYSAPASAYVCWAWTENTTGTIHVIFDKIPEFESFLLPMFGVMVLCAIIRSRARRKDTQ